MSKRALNIPIGHNKIVHVKQFALNGNENDVSNFYFTVATLMLLGM